MGPIAPHYVRLRPNRGPIGLQSGPRRLRWSLLHVTVSSGFSTGASVLMRTIYLMK